MILAAAVAAGTALLASHGKEWGIADYAPPAVALFFAVGYLLAAIWHKLPHLLYFIRFVACARRRNRPDTHGPASGMDIVPPVPWRAFVPGGIHPVTDLHAAESATTGE